MDGKEFFDGDVNLAIKNLPSDIIAGIEVFDKRVNRQNLPDSMMGRR